VRDYRRRRSWSSDLAEGLRKALRNPGPVAIRRLLTATLAPDESGGVFLAAKPRLRLLGAVPGAGPFRQHPVLVLARRGIAAPPNVVIVPDSPVSEEWPAALALALPRRRGALVLLARTAISAETRSRAELLASVLAIIVELGLRRRAPRRSAATLSASARRTAGGRGMNAVRHSLAAARRIGRAIATGRSVEYVFRLTTRELRRLLTFDTAGLLTIDRTGDGTLMTVDRSRRASRIRPVSREGSARVAVALRRRRALIVNDAATARTPLSPLLRSDVEARSALVLPLVVEGEAVGAMILGSRAPGHFRHRQVRLLRPVAPLLALAIQHTRERQARPVGTPEARYLAIGRLAEALAHEIRNPLTIIGTTLQYLRNRRLVADEYIPLLEAGVRKTREVDDSLDSLLSLSRPIKLRLEQASIATLLNDVAEFIRVRAAEHAIDVTVDADAQLVARLDRRFLGQALLNLALNAIDAMRGGGLLTFAARWAPETRALVVTVSDTGSGIEREHLNVIFDPHFTTKLHGTGLGLAITRRIVEEHGGTVRVASERGRGTTFTVTLPDYP
jgi:signal transduction histidine kinase